MTPGGKAEAFYRQGELHRLRGELDAAEDAYRAASRRPRHCAARRRRLSSAAMSSAHWKVSAADIGSIARALLLPR